MSNNPSAQNAPEAQPTGATGYLADEEFLEPLLAELGEVRDVHGRLVLADGPPRPAAWALNIWYDPVVIPIASIKQGAKALRSIQRNWAPYTFQHHRRASLIQENLPHVSAKPMEFYTPAPTAPLGSWTLLDESTILAAPHCSSPFPNGEVRFVENRSAPPARAYLKLWEVFTRLGVMPTAGELCLDLGACPGGWTWVLQGLGANVIAVDKAPIDPAIARLPGVSQRLESAFGLNPAEVGPVDWLFSDIICYPARLLRLVRSWMDTGMARNFVCTLKFQGETDHETARAFAAIPGSQLMHLSVNKHELTWVLTR
ncbi:SAM-dependent methyltransferase [Indioceanicola profundi]|uniref:SAM-dependent methyltransferase n=1 Tax=Indioceanicola profundi TaxID=2220096 RepID=UPI000E6AAE90|nr:SAM-dependent methyltransferase [Indioceanicola profundi]